ncbi:MAG: glycosyltransferase family 4 protein [Microbacterium sp.]|uniref:glycosyltransferase family 4 protein n=1 Tax=Microbacterium sp. TaxID=51671 RepID=UPI0039E4CCDD
MDERPRVLHVVERMGGGLADAVISYAQRTPGFEHHLIFAHSNDASFDENELDCFTSVTFFREGHLRRIRQVSRLSKSLGIDIIHGHSAFGGLYARVARARRSIAIAYTPHCFPFERLDVTRLVRRAFLAIEWALAKNTTVFIACGRREQELSRRLSARASAVYVTNVARTFPSSDSHDIPRGDQTLVVGAGRIMQQKGTTAFANIAAKIREAPQHLPARFVWIGDGTDEVLRGQLIDAGVEITGWLDRAEVLKLMRQATLYLHTASWEGFPIALLEAVAVGAPALAIKRPYTSGLPPEILAEEDDATRRIRDLLRSAELRAMTYDTAHRAFEGNNPKEQSRQLNSAYNIGLASTRR